MHFNNGSCTGNSGILEMLPPRQWSLKEMGDWQFVLH